jgi:hypothetical protein
MLGEEPDRLDRNRAQVVAFSSPKTWLKATRERSSTAE